LGYCLSALYAEKPLYVVSPLLKIDPEIGLENLEIEVREDREIWDDAPHDLKIYNPAFEIVDNYLITGFVTEFGILKPKEIADIVKAKYPWLFES
jgi:methylthioribose-1-phosphate isomerase